MVVAGEHLCKVEDLVTDQRLQVYVDVTKELRVIVRIHGEGELHMANLTIIGHLDDGLHNMSVEWIGRAGNLRENLLGTFHDARSFFRVNCGR